MPDEFSHTFGLVREFFTISSPPREQRIDDPLECVEIPRGPGGFAFYTVLQQIGINPPVHALYRPMLPDSLSDKGIVRG